MNINVSVLCPACKGCDKLDVEQTDLWADDHICEKLFTCSNLNICLKAVEIWEKQNDQKRSH